MTDRQSRSTAHPEVRGRCPACRGESLFLGSGGHVTCSRLDCPNPCAVDELLHGEHPAAAGSAGAGLSRAEEDEAGAAYELAVARVESSGPRPVQAVGLS